MDRLARLLAAPAAPAESAGRSSTPSTVRRRRAPVRRSDPDAGAARRLRFPGVSASDAPARGNRARGGRTSCSRAASSTPVADAQPRPGVDRRRGGEGPLRGRPGEGAQERRQARGGSISGGFRLSGLGRRAPPPAGHRKGERDRGPAGRGQRRGRSAAPGEGRGGLPPGAWAEGRRVGPESLAGERVSGRPFARPRRAGSPGRGSPCGRTRALGQRGGRFEAAGIASSTRDPEGGRILRRARRFSVRRAVDNAMELVSRAMPVPSAADRERWFLAGAATCARAGLTEVQDASGYGARRSPRSSGWPRAAPCRSASMRRCHPTRSDLPGFLPGERASAAALIS